MTLDTLVFLRGLLAAQVIEVGRPDFAAVAEQAGRALAELDEMIVSSPDGAAQTAVE